MLDVVGKKEEFIMCSSFKKLVLGKLDWNFHSSLKNGQDFGREEKFLKMKIQRERNQRYLKHSTE